MLTLSVSIVFCFVLICSGSKYSADNNRSVPDFTEEDRPYRMQKINLLWEKARKRLSGSMLADLYVDLKVQDKHEFALKKLKADDMDKDGLQEAKVNAAFTEIVDKYGLGDIYGTGAAENSLPDDGQQRPEFKDPKLQSMWKRAEAAGFTERDLQKLKEEFMHQQMKIDEMNFLKQELNIEDSLDNEVEGAKKPGKADQQTREYDLKSQGKEIKAGYYKLEGMISDFDREEPEFKDHRVYKLWALAKKTDWSPEQLESFKEELVHFERRLKKHEHFQEQLKQSERALRDQVQDGRYPEKHVQLEEKSRDLGQKVKKLHDELKTRVSKAFASTQHTEL